MDSKIVNKAVRSDIRPVLKELGFTKIAGRSYCRFFDDVTHVINFQSFNSYNADVIGCTTYSFCVNLGCYFHWIPECYPDSNKNSSPPKEFECHFRSGLRRTIDQRELERRDIWYIDPQGRYIEQAMADVISQIKNSAVPMFNRFMDTDEVFRTLIEDSEDMDAPGVWGMGNVPSPSRSFKTAFTAYKLGLKEIAEVHFQKVIDSECYTQVFKSLDEAIEIANKSVVATPAFGRK